MRRAADASAVPSPDESKLAADNKELLRQQLLSSRRAPPSPRRARQKNRWKLKFHHQALPQEYLDHYEQSLQRADAVKKNKDKIKTEQDVSNEALKVWAQRLASMTDRPAAVTRKPHKPEERKKKHTPAIAPSKIVTYDDLPYMGEMTLNNSKPRRGRKPKKADICHLIYENYGTVVPGQPTPPEPPRRTATADHSAINTSKTDLQNKIISSLLERKLSQESKRRESLGPHAVPRVSPHHPLPAAPLTLASPLHSDSEPLNLCIRDLHELKIQIQRKFGNIYSSLPDVKDEAEDEDSKSEQPNAISVIQRNTLIPPATAGSSPDLSRRSTNISPTLSEPARSSLSPDADEKFPGNFVYWPNAGMYMHPLALQTQLLYYQKLAAAGQLPFSIERDGSSPNSVGGESASTELSTPPTDEAKSKLVLKQISELLDPKVVKQAEEAERPEASAAKRNSPRITQTGPVKRKRSAIFIPPIPTKTNSSTPTAEVSICKFKFTGGSKPSLQEKKMLSVDSGGNFTYYSGTGTTKGNKGYDYLNGNRPIEITDGRPEQGPSNSGGKEEVKKKRKSRKSLQREKLEQTFKEKGFLIQTQQLQSAEGATYCKFRQLRKFTRYLFRSWKDYLPLEERGGESRTEPSAEPGLAPEGEWG